MKNEVRCCVLILARYYVLQLSINFLFVVRGLFCFAKLEFPKFNRHSTSTSNCKVAEYPRKADNHLDWTSNRVSRQTQNLVSHFVPIS